jgi:serine/threonine-protein kinase
MAGNVSRRRILVLAVVGLLAAAAGLAAHATGALNWLERSSVDERFSLRGRQSPPPGVVLVGIDNDSLGNLPRYPFSRRLHAQVIDNLHAAGARLIVYDISFDRPTSQAADLALFDAAQRAAPVVFATSLISPSGSTQVLGGDSNLASIGAQAAAANLVPDSDGVLRHLLDQVHGLPTVASAVARTLDGHPANRSQLRGGWIDYRGPPGTVRSLSFLRVLQDQFDPRAVRGKLVVVGATAPLLQDLHSTSAGGPMPGPEVQAQAISTVLSGFPLRGSSGAVSVLLIILLAVLVPVVGVRLGTLGSGLVGLGIVAAWSLATQLAFDNGTVLDYSDPLASLLLGIGGTLTMTLWADSRERRRLRTLFAANSAALVEQVLRPSGARPLEPTAIIAGYRIEEVVGRGGMGVVYRATQLALQRTVAIKLIATERTQDPVFRERFKLESRIAASIEHASVVPVYEAGEDDGLLFIAMRLVEGIDLAQLLERLGALEPARALRLGNQLAGALDAAHARGLVHRDVKPANVLLTVDEPEHAYLTDFGVAKQIGASAGVTRIDQWVGTLDYLAPEQIRGDPVDASADIYALAGLLHHCLTGQTPFPRDTEAAKLWAHVNAAPPSPNQLRPSLPQALDDVIARGMAKDPARRFATAAELVHACAHALGIPRAVSNAPASPVTPGQISKGSGGVASTAISE